MRIKELVNTINNGEYTSSADVTSDVTNTFAPGVPNQIGMLLNHAGAMDQGNAKNLKASGVDNKITRLGWDPT